MCYTFFDYKKTPSNFIYFTTIDKQVLQLILISFVVTDYKQSTIINTLKKNTSSKNITLDKYPSHMRLGMTNYVSVIIKFQCDLIGSSESLTSYL